MKSRKVKIIKKIRVLRYQMMMENFVIISRPGTKINRSGDVIEKDKVFDLLDQAPSMACLTHYRWETAS